MGKNKNNAVAETKFIPRISSASRKIAARRIEQSASQGIPHFMREIKSRVPLAPITSNENTFFTRVRREFTESKESNETDPLLKTPGKETLKPIAMNKQPSVLLDDNVFTFRPKVSSTSAKIVENMGTDFMARQQQHLEKQKKLIERAGYSFKSSPGHLSPLSQYKRLKERGFKIDETDNNNTNSQPTDLDQPETPKSDAPGDDLSDTMPSLQRNNSGISAGLQRILDGPYSNGNPDMVLKRHKTRIRSHNKGNKSVGDNSDMDDFRDDIENGSALSRSKTMPSLGRPKLTRKITAMAQSSDRLTKAKDQAEKAIRLKKVFTIQGGYSAIRQCLRRRGWVEKFYRIPAPQKTTKKRRRKGDDDENDDGDDDDDDDDGDDDDDTDSDNDQPKVAPWEEDDGIYGIMSRIVRNVNPTFIWVLKRDVIDYRFLTKDQMVNHYCKAGSFTTKVGLCVNMRQVPWFDESDPDEFYPRCYRLSHEEEKAAFIDDFRLTSCVNILKIITNQYMEGGECNEESRDKDTVTKEPAETSQPFECTNPECTRSRPNQTTDNLCAHALQKQAEDEKKRKEKELLASDEEAEDTTAGMEVEYDENGVIKPPDSSRRKLQQKKKRIIVPQKCLDRAIVQCEKYLTFRSHDDIDQATERDSLSPAQWDEMIVWYYQLVHEGGIIPNVPASILGQIENILNRVKAVWPQFELDGVKNVWIVKPGAKSRGRGITCYDRLEEMLKLVNSQVVRKDNKYVVQKYIERPLLIHNCKFDIRQWFLVTDWNPLTLYFYQDSYLRFCSQQFTLEDYDESIHLSNNAIQKHYKNGPRSTELPEENMWTHDQFKDYIKNQGYSNLWDDMIYPGMKKAIVCALLSTQDLVEYRKSSFELYGADFMLTEDYKPWLIEINSSPSMESSTEITSRLCASVLEDTLKVVLDRKWDRNCDIGRFELAFKQPLVTVPPYIGINLCAEGGAIKKPGWMNVVKKTTNESEFVFSPRKEKQVIFNDKLMGSSVEPVSKTAGNSRRPHSENQDDHNSSAKPVNSAPVKKSSNREASDSNSHHVKKKSHSKSPKILNNMSNQMNQSNSNTSVAAEKSNSDSASVYSHQQSENGRNDENTEDDVRSERRIIHSTSSSPILAPKMSMFGSGAIPSTNYVPSLASKKIVSRTSVSTNYTIPSDNRERPALSVNNVETTDLKTLKAQAKGRRRRKKYRLGRSLPVYPTGSTDPVKLHFSKGTTTAGPSPYMMVQKLPVIKVHIINHGQ